AAYLERALEARRRGRANNRPGQPGARTAQGPLVPKESVGLKPLNEMTAEDRYQDEEGGLYGGGRNSPSGEHLKATEAAVQQIGPLDAGGKPDASGRIVLISISMSNATQEFSTFKRLADVDKD